MSIIDSLLGKALQGKENRDSRMKEIVKGEEARRYAMNNAQNNVGNSAMVGGTWDASINTTRSQTTAPPDKTYPIQGQGIKLVTELGELCDPSMLKNVLIDMTQSGDGRERAYAAMHKDTPMSAITMNLLSDRDPTVRYLAEKRLEGWNNNE